MNQSHLLKELAQNASLLLAMVLVFDLFWTDDRTGRKPGAALSVGKRLFIGVLFGLILLLVMKWTVVVPPGFLFDTRSVLLCLCGLFFGFIPTVVAAMMAGLYRCHLGGPGLWTGLVTILWSAGIGLVWRRSRRQALDRIRWPELLLLGLTAHVLLTFGILLQPVDWSRYSLWRTIMPACAIYILGTVLLGMLLVHRIRREKRALVLRSSEERHRVLFEKAGDAMLILAGTPVHVSDANAVADRLFMAEGRRPLKGIPFRNLVESTADRDAVIADAVAQALQAGSWNGELRLVRLDGSDFPAEIVLSRLEAHGDVTVHAHLRDLTEKKQSEEALRLSEAMHRSLIETSTDGVWWVGTDGRILRVNDAYCRMSGYTREELLTMWVADFECIESEEMVRDHIRQVIQAGRQCFVSHHRRRDGSTYPVEVSLQYLPLDGGRVVAFLRDITERKRLEEALERRLVALTRPLETDHAVTFEELFDLDMIQRIQDEFATAVGVASVITRPDGTPITKPTRFCRLCATLIRQSDKGLRNCYCSDAVVGRPHPGGPVVQPCLSGGLFDAGASISVGGRHVASWLIGQVRTGPESEEKIRAYAREIGIDEEEAAAAFAEVPTMPLERFQHVARVLHTLANQLSTQAFQNVQQARFIAERRKVEQALAHSERELRLVWEEAQDGMRLTDAEGNVRRVNEAYCRLVGMSRAELEGRPFSAAYDQVEGLVMLESYRKKFELGIIAPRLETRVVLWDGRVLDLELSNSRLSLPGAEDLVLSLVRDISDRRRSELERQQLQAQLVQARKMEAVGRLAGGVAHDFNNLLAAMMLQLSMLEEKPSLDPEVQEAIADLREEATRAANLTRQLLMFSRRAVLQVRVIDLNAVVDNLLRMLRRLIGEQVTLVFRREEPLPAIRADAGMIEQVLLNLTVNARDAMPEGGTIIIRTAARSISESDLRHPQAKRQAGDFVVLTVSDTGCGIPQEILPVIFEPFFSTKGQGQGTGLGLCTVDGIVNQHKGWIEVESEVGKGSSFHVFLPKAAAEAPSAKPAAQQASSTACGDGGVPVCGGERILLVEDEASVRTIARRSLERKGYRVTEASNALEALERWRDAEGGFELLLTDMVMPEGMNGLSLARQLLAQKPSLRVIIASGYSEDLARMEEVQPIRMEFLPKPFDIAVLIEAVRRCLGDSRRE